MIIPLVGLIQLFTSLTLLQCNARATALQLSGRRPPSKIDGGGVVDCVLHNDDDWSKVYFDIAIPSSPYSSECVPLGRLTFYLVPSSHPQHLPLHASNLVSLASGEGRSIDPRATYVGCEFKHSPASVEDGSMRYGWSHACDGNGRKGIRTLSPSGIRDRARFVLLGSATDEGLRPRLLRGRVLRNRLRGDKRVASYHRRTIRRYS
jgi:hypothetical protein